MRRTALIMALALPLALYAAPTLALDRLPRPGGDASAVSRVADLDHPLHADTYRHRDAYWHWHYRAAYMRWLHNEHVRAGYPIQNQHFRTYARDYVCCHRYRRW